MTQDPALPVTSSPTRAKTKAEGKPHDGPLVLIGFHHDEDPPPASQPPPFFRKGNDILLGEMQGGKMVIDPVQFARRVYAGSAVLLAEEIPDVNRNVGLIRLERWALPFGIEAKPLWSDDSSLIFRLSDIHPDLNTSEDAYVVCAFLNSIRSSKPPSTVEVAGTDRNRAL